MTIVRCDHVDVTVVVASVFIGRSRTWRLKREQMVSLREVLEVTRRHLKVRYNATRRTYALLRVCVYSS